MPAPIDTACSSYFRVKDAEAFKAWTTNRQIDYNDVSIDGHLYFMIFPKKLGDNHGYPCEKGGWGSCYPLDNSDDDEFPPDHEIIASELSKHLPSGKVAVLKEFKSEKQKWGVHAVIVRANGELQSLDFDQFIASAAKKARGD